MSLSPAPKNHVANIRYRRAILDRCLQDENFKHEVWIRCSRDLVWWVDTFCWTYSPKDYVDCPNRPFILYEYQEGSVTRINRALGRHDLLIEKSRDMGATWICLVVFLWRWMFHPLQSFLVGSRKEEEVDKTGNTKTLFWKIDFLLANLPGWLRPNPRRNSLLLENLDNGSIISGESTNDNFARGDRRTAILLDEFAAVENGDSILSATQDATNCRLFNSTPAGASGAYYDTGQKMKIECPEQIIRLHWSVHPEKSLGLYTTVDGKRDGQLLMMDTKHKPASDYRFVLDGKKRSPWYDLQCRRAPNQKQIAQQLDIDYAGSAWQYFDADVIDRLIREMARPPLHTGEFTFDDNGGEVKWIPQRRGRVRLWVNPDPYGIASLSLACSVGVDIAMGTGSSSSAISVVNKTTGEKVLQFVSNQIHPHDLAVYAVAICRWLNDALLIWETNGSAGGLFTNKLKSLPYRNIFYRQDEKKFNSVKTETPGWGSSKEGKAALLGEYARALIDGRFVNRDEDSLRECLEYIHGPDGSVYHVKSKTDDPTASGENHGDMVIADALANRGLTEVSRSDKTDESEVPMGSFLERRLESKRVTSKADFY